MSKEKWIHLGEWDHTHFMSDMRAKHAQFAEEQERIQKIRKLTSHICGIVMMIISVPTIIYFNDVRLPW
jgi:hypothetical protein